MSLIVIIILAFLAGFTQGAGDVDVSGVTGAQLNETAVVHELHVSVNGDDNHPEAGSAAHPYRTINAAANQAGQSQQLEQSTRVVIHPGIYRETVNALLNYPIKGTVGAAIIFEAAEPDSVIISGSEVYDSWQALGDGVYQHSWAYDWGLWVDVSNMSGYELQKLLDEPVLRRREMVFANGELLRQVLSYSGLTGMENSFYVDDVSNAVYIHLPDLQDINETQIEVAERMYLFQCRNNRAIMVRGLIFEHATNALSQGGSHEGKLGAVNFVRCEDILFEDNVVRWNNANGWSFTGETVVDGGPARYYCCERITCKRNVSNYNGIAGAETNITRNSFFLDNETSYNNWRGQWADLSWGWTGTRFYRMHDAIVRGHVSIGNYARGIWFDYDAANVLLEGARLNDNVDGLKFEVDQGPFLVKDSEISGNSGVGLLYHVSHDVRLENCQLENNGVCQVFVDNGQFSRYLSDWENNYPAGYLDVSELELHHCLVGGQAGQLLADVPYYSVFLNSFVSGDNYWYHSAMSNCFELGGTLYNFAGWQTTTGQDSDSQWHTSQPVPSSCGDWGTIYRSADFNKDCTVDLADYADLAAQWEKHADERLVERVYLIEPIQDTTLDSKQPYSTSGGTAETLSNYIWNGSSVDKRCSLMRFDVSCIPADLAGAIVSAQLSIFANSYLHNGSSEVTGKGHGWHFHRMLSPWDENDSYADLGWLVSGVQYASSWFGDYVHLGSDGPGEKWIGGLETAVANWVSGTWDNNGFVIISYAPSGMDMFNVVSFRAQEYDDWQNQNPYLKVVVQAPAQADGSEGDWSANLNGDGTVNMIDMALLGQQWLND